MDLLFLPDQFIPIMQRYFMELSYKGTRYFGWQVQPGHLSVQEMLETRFSLFFRHPVAVTGAGRTDTGVHAGYYVAHFEAETLPFSPSDTVHKLNRFLPSDIALRSIWAVPPDAHARFSALSRTYTYTINRQKDPFTEETAWYCPFPLDMGLMNEAASVLPRHADFTSFCKLHSDVKTNLCRIEEAIWREDGSQLSFTITADRFLRNMVRAIVGTLVNTGRGKLSVHDFEEILLRKDRSAAGTSAPAHGLSLTGICYPGELFAQRT